MIRFIGLSLLLLTACQTESHRMSSDAPHPEGQAAHDSSSNGNSAALPPPDTAQNKAISAVSDTLRVVRQRHNFSQPKGPADVFQLTFRGPNWLEGSGEFTITDASGQVIFREMLTEPDLEAALVYEMKTPTATPAEREAYVRRRVEQFFQQAQFRTPAVARSATFPTGVENLDQTTWNDLRQRPDAIGFEYLKGKEDRRVIAWSPPKKQTVRVR